MVSDFRVEGCCRAISEATPIDPDPEQNNPKPLNPKPYKR